jgi:hypothetical protein
MNSISNQYIEFAKTIMPWVTGGLAGAILTLLSKAYVSRRTKKTLSVKVHSLPFKLPSIKTKSKFKSEDLKITYKQSNYKNLLYYEISFYNSGKRNITNQTFVICFPKETVFVDHEFFSEPIKFIPFMNDNPTDKCLEKTITFNTLSVDDSFTLVYLLDCSNPEEIHIFNRSDDVIWKVNEVGGYSSLEKDLYQVLLGLVFIWIVKSIDFFGFVFASMALVILYPALKRVLYALAEKYTRYNAKETTAISIENGPRTIIKIEK